MADILYWYGASTDASVSTNWKKVSDGTTKLPADGDTVYFDDRSVLASGRRQDCLCTSWAVKNLVVIVKSTYDGTIGSSANPFLLKSYQNTNVIYNPYVLFGGTGTAYIKASTAGFITRLLAQGGSGSNLYLYGDGANAYFDTIEAASGTITIAASARINRIRSVDSATIYGKNNIRDSSGSADTAIHQCGGIMSWQSNIGDADICGGVFNWGGSDDATLYTGSITNTRDVSTAVRIYRGATFNWQTQATDTSGTAIASNLKKFTIFNGGVLKVSSTINQNSSKIIGSATADPYDVMEVWPTGQALFENGSSMVVMKNTGTVLRNLSGAVTIPTAKPLNWT